MTGTRKPVEAFGPSICRPCPVGFYTSAPGSVTCVACLAGKYQRKGGGEEAGRSGIMNNSQHVSPSVISEAEFVEQH